MKGAKGELIDKPKYRDNYDLIFKKKTKEAGK